MKQDFLADFYLKAAYYIDEKKAGEQNNVRLYERGGKEYPKYSVYGLGIHSSHIARALSELKVGEKYQNYTRVN